MIFLFNIPKSDFLFCNSPPQKSLCPAVLKALACGPQRASGYMNLYLQILTVLEIQTEKLKKDIGFKLFLNELNKPITC